jgi:phytoene dehydrogenase-like protein
MTAQKACRLGSHAARPYLSYILGSIENYDGKQVLPQYDSIVVGAGHNGLVCAAYLARGGQRVLILEAAAETGGLAAVREFHPGFFTSVAHSTCHFSESVAADLNLAAYGFKEQSIATIGLSPTGDHVSISDGKLHGVSGADAGAFGDYSRLMRAFAGALQPFWLKTIPRIGSTGFADIATFAKLGLKLRGLGKSDMREFMRIASLPMRDLMDEYFDGELVKAMLSWDGLIGSKMAPRSPNSAVIAMLYRMSGRSHGAHAIPAGGAAGLAKAICQAAETAGAEVQCDAPVDHVIIESSLDGLIATGVQLADGTRLDANNVISSADPRRTFVNLVGVQHLDIEFTNRIRRLRCDGYVAKLHLALDGLPQFNGLEQPDGRMIIAPTMDTIEFAYDDAKYGDCSESPVMEVVIPSIHDASLTPDGQHVLSAHVMYVPYALKGGWTDAAREQALQRAIDTISDYAPRIREQIVASELLTPYDLEQEYRVTGGHWHHADIAMDQMLMMRPTYGAAQYSTPIPGLFLCGAGSHPAGDLVGAAGHNAAREVMR